MSEFEDDIDDQLLALAGATERKSKKSKKSASRKRKSPVDSDSEREIESGEDADADEVSDPYPYEGQYVDEDDKQRLLSLPEIKREEILAERIEEKQRLQEKQVLAQMVKQQRSGGGGGGVVGIDDDSVARAAKRQHTARGVTKEKTRKLDELKAKRKAKDESRKRAKLSPTSHRRSTSPQDMDISDEESEDGQFTRSDQEEERERRLLGHHSKKEEEVEDKTPASIEDFNKCRLTRDLVAKWCLAPWFPNYVKRAWVRYLIGNENNEPVYRMCEIQELSANPVKPYKINDRMVDRAVELKHGKSIKQFNMDRISNAEFTLREYKRLEHTCKTDAITLPTRKSLQEKAEEMKKLQSQPLTDSDISLMIKRKKELSSTKSSADMVLERSRLNQARSLALKRLDQAEADELEQKITALEAQIASTNGSNGTPRKSGEDRDDVLRRVNERNRKANTESVRRAEIAENERKRKEREQVALAAASGGAAAAAAIHTKYDPSARLKTMPRLFNAATPSSRPGTPASGSKSGTPAPTNASTALPNKEAAIRSLPSANTTMAFEKKLLDSMELDLGDF